MNKQIVIDRYKAAFLVANGREPRITDRGRGWYMVDGSSPRRLREIEQMAKVLEARVAIVRGGE